VISIEGEQKTLQLQERTDQANLVGLPWFLKVYVSHYLSYFPFYELKVVELLLHTTRICLYTIIKVNLSIRTDSLRFEQRSPETFLCFDLQIISVEYLLLPPRSALKKRFRLDHSKTCVAIFTHIYSFKYQS